MVAKGQLPNENGHHIIPSSLLRTSVCHRSPGRDQESEMNVKERGCKQGVSQLAERVGYSRLPLPCDSNRNMSFSKARSQKCHRVEIGLLNMTQCEKIYQSVKELFLMSSCWTFFFLYRSAQKLKKNASSKIIKKISWRKTYDEQFSNRLVRFLALSHKGIFSFLRPPNGRKTEERKQKIRHPKTIISQLY